MAALPAADQALHLLHGDRSAGGCSGITSPAGDKPQSSTASGPRPCRQPGAAASGQEVPSPFLIAVLGARWVGTAGSPPSSLPQCPSRRSPAGSSAPKGLLSTLPPPRGEAASLRGAGRDLPELALQEDAWWGGRKGEASFHSA